MSDPIAHVVVGPARHGVVRFGVALDQRLRSNGFPIELRSALGRTAQGRGVHVQFTDRLFGADAVQAAVAVSEFAAMVHCSGARISATLHDLPQPSDGEHYSTRAHAYASLASTLDAVVVSSDHERELLSTIGFRGRTSVIPLPVTPPVHGPSPSSHPPSVGMFGFVYPGKGHAEVLDAMERLPPGVAMTVIGEPSAGHEDLIEHLAATARAQGRRFEVTGHVTDGAVNPLLHGVSVPVVHHRHVSASGSLNSWLTAGRRPLVASTRYTREIAIRNPGGLLLYEDDPDSLAAALRAALDEPESTWLPPGFACSPTPDQVARCYARFLRGVHR
ncbi:glycosyltransferase [Mycolicibacterium arenosum]|uniref:Glycosyl transferase family 1 n=1 Tax=Mycolicibacterium arenosum TaxID=2952157 RepID=A0ABT1M3A0_9MYCO|nr:glycosyltransferase [Mycolicibacterium sp. CAU 1645]MCP9273634.1 hypothetical protein [Mycolicibacterium sp. CAU 1645]